MRCLTATAAKEIRLSSQPAVLVPAVRASRPGTIPGLPFRKPYKQLICRSKAASNGDDRMAGQAQAPSFRVRLGYIATLTPVETGLSISVSVLLSAAYYLARAPDHFSIRFALLAALLFAASLTICRSFLLERKHQDRLLAEQDLKDEDSVFRELNGTAVHYKLAQGINPSQPLAVHCYHGFGANTFSWSYVYKALSEQLQAQVTKHDMPGFGLTQRPRHISGYSLDGNGQLGRLVMDAELAAAGILKPSTLGGQVGLGVTLEELQSVSSHYQAGQREREPPVSANDIQSAAAAGHALDGTAPPPAENPTEAMHNSQQGNEPSIQDANASSELPSSQQGLSGDSRPRAASQPASPLSSQSSWDSVSSVDSRALGQERGRASGNSRAYPRPVKRVLIGHSMGAACAAAEDIAGLIMVAPAIFTKSSQVKAREDAQAGGNPTTRVSGSQGNPVLRVLMAVGKALGKRTTGLVLWLLQPVLVLLLRILVRSRLFWVRGLSNAWHSREGVSDELVDAYRLPQLVRGWEVGLIRFARAGLFADNRSLVQIARDAYHSRAPLSQVEQLAQAVAQEQIKVLILHGVGDRLVPATNSKRLARLIPGAELLIYQDCGHVPQEELPKQFIQSVKAFVSQC